MAPISDIPEGSCQCGCGQKTGIATSSCAKRFQVKGRPFRFIQSHAGRIRVSVEEAQPFKIDGVYCRLIPLNKGLHAIVDATDYEWLMQWKWGANYDSRTKSYYAIRRGLRIDGKQETIQMHRQILGLKKGDRSLGDHANRLTLDNRRMNLRPATPAQNEQNRKISTLNTSGFKGVTFNKQRGTWAAYIRVSGRKINLGNRHTAAEASSLYAAAAARYHKEFARVA